MATITAPTNTRHFDVLDLARIAGPQASVIHTSRSIESYPFVCLYAFRGHAVVRQRADSLRIEVGQLIILKNDSSLAVDVPEDAEMLAIRLPRAASEPYRDLFEDQAGRSWDGDSGSAHLVGGFLDRLLQQFDTYQTNHPARFAQTLVGVLGLMCVDGERAQVDASGALIFESAREFIDEHLADTDLNPDMIAMSLHVSTRTLHRVFERKGSTVSAWIRHQRLERCRVDLTDPRLSAHRVSDIGARWGIADSAHFSRLFKQAHGQSPRRYRIDRLEGLRVA